MILNGFYENIQYFIVPFSLLLTPSPLGHFFLPHFLFSNKIWLISDPLYVFLFFLASFLNSLILLSPSPLLAAFSFSRHLPFPICYKPIVMAKTAIKWMRCRIAHVTCQFNKQCCGCFATYDWAHMYIVQATSK